MRIMNFIKNYPIVIFSSIILIICFSLLAIPQKIYAQTKASKNPDCDCITRDCPNGVKPNNISCSQVAAGCKCNVGENPIEIYGSCTNTSAQKCVRIKGCTNCTPYDCNPTNPCEGDGICKGCKKYVVTSGFGKCVGIGRDPDGNIVTCGTCAVDESRTDLGVV